MSSLDAVKNAFGAKGTTLGEDLYNKLKPYQDRATRNNGDGFLTGDPTLNYVPVILSTQAAENLKDAVKKGDAKVGEDNGIKTYLLSFNNVLARGIMQSREGEDGKFSFSTDRAPHILVKIGVIDKFYTGIDLKISTTNQLVNNYLKYYFDNESNKFDGKVINYNDSKSELK